MPSTVEESGCSSLIMTTWYAGSWMASRKRLLHHSLMSGVSGKVLRKYSLLEWNERWTIVEREGRSDLVAVVRDIVAVEWMSKRCVTTFEVGGKGGIELMKVGHVGGGWIS